MSYAGPDDIVAGQIFRESRSIYRPLAGPGGRPGTRELQPVFDRALRCARPAAPRPGRRYARTQRLRLRAGRNASSRRRRRRWPNRPLSQGIVRSRSETKPLEGRRQSHRRAERSLHCGKRPGKGRAGARQARRPPRLGCLDDQCQAAGGGICPSSPALARLAAVHPGLRRWPLHRGLCRLHRTGEELHAVPGPAELPHLS